MGRPPGDIGMVEKCWACLQALKTRLCARGGSQQTTESGRGCAGYEVQQLRSRKIRRFFCTRDPVASLHRRSVLTRRKSRPRAMQHTVSDVEFEFCDGYTAQIKHQPPTLVLTSTG